ncbi:MAG: DEAD/DEAH box helicase [Myxococcales bacterium]|nr:DEAD/DEAH box helicase [Myxococcales bacterium]
MSPSQPVSATGFDRFELHPDLVRGVRAAGFVEPRPIQVETIPAALEGADVLGLAQTGTGKTAAFALPLLDQLLDARKPGPRALVLAPTRELATQIDAEIRLLAKFTRLKTALVFGGASMRAQIDALRRRPEVVVACPGRLLDLMGQGVVRLGDVETLVLDEADHMFDMGFLPDIRRILSALPKERQNLLFSATMPREIRGLADEVLYDAHVAELAGTAPAETIEHALYPVPEAHKRDLLEHILASAGCDSAIVFTRTKHRARRLAQQLDKAGHRAIGLQGNMSQAQRDRAMRGFRSRRFDILVATDIAARGIDVSGVSYVINYDVPNTPEAYTHRIGRTGRSEREGKACTFVTREDWGWVRATERMIGEPIPRRQVERFTEREVARGARPAGSRTARGRTRDAVHGRPRVSRGRRRGARSRNTSRPAVR